jgi:hypothetical protein
LARHLSALHTIELLAAGASGRRCLSLAYPCIHLYYLLHRADQVTAQHACKSGIPRMLISGFEATYSPAHFPAFCMRTYPSVDKSSVKRHDTYLLARIDALHCVALRDKISGAKEFPSGRLLSSLHSAQASHSVLLAIEFSCQWRMG